MSNKNIYKPRYTLAFIAKSKTWPHKDSFLRRLYAIRSTRVRRGGLFRRFVLRATSIKWTEVRRFFHPLKRHQASTPINSSSVGFGRLMKPKFNYRESFYIKQQLRFFHGKIKEQAFRRFFQTHISSIANQSKSFFASLESRLDIVFFRRRLLPTIYACHQFIHYNGIEKNGKRESAPSTLVDVSDIVSVPQKVWTIFYSRVFLQVYFRRWGLFTTRQRVLTSFKKVFSKLQHKYHKQSKFIRFRPRYSKYKKDFKFNIKSSKLAISFRINSKDNKLSLTNSILNEDKLGFKKSSNSSRLAKWKNFHSFSTSLTKWAKASPYNKRAYTFSGMRMPIVNQDLFREPYAAIAPTYFKKRQHYQKLLLSLRLRNSNIARFTMIKKKGYNLLQIYKKRAKKSKRLQGTPRLKDVHFYIPAHLQIDFRTLRVIKLKAPLIEETYYPFRISLPKVYSFYRIKGF